MGTNRDRKNTINMNKIALYQYWDIGPSMYVGRDCPTTIVTLGFLSCEGFQRQHMRGQAVISVK